MSTERTSPSRDEDVITRAATIIGITRHMPDDYDLDMGVMPEPQASPGTTVKKTIVTSKGVASPSTAASQDWDLPD